MAYRHRFVILFALLTACGNNGEEPVQEMADMADTPDVDLDALDSGLGKDFTHDTGITLCREDEYVDAQATCVACAAGTTNNAGDDPSAGETSCQAIFCPVGYFVQQHQCSPCPTGTTTADVADASGPDTVCSSILCEADQHVEGGRCVTCAPGTTNEAGDDASQGDSSCQPVTCMRDTHVQGHLCVPCTPGQSNVEGDDASGADTVCDAGACASNRRVAEHRCVACAPGYVNPAGDDPTGPDTSCSEVICQRNEHVHEHTCLPCPRGSKNDFMDSAAGPDTSCQSLICRYNEHVQDHECVDCPPGTTNLSGDEQAGPDTTCQPVVCPENYHVDYNSCEPCPRGSTRPAGDVATGSNTSCEATLCGVDEYVDDHMCVACLPGSTNEAGDNARLSDTECDSDLVEVYSSSTTLCALFATGGPKCWGGNVPGSSIDPIPLHSVPSGVVQMGLGDSHACLMLDTGTIKCWSSVGATPSTSPQTLAANFPQPVAFIRALQRSGIAVLTNGDVYQWSLTSAPQKTFTLPSVPVALEASSYSICALLSGGNVECWGSGSFGTFGNNDQPIPAGEHTVTPTGLDTGVIALAGAETSYCAIVQNGDVKCWGANAHGQVGDGTTTRRYVPTTVTGLPSPARSIAVSGGHTCALLTNDELWCWGLNDWGQLGDGTRIDSSTPVRATLPFTSQPLQSIHVKMSETCARTEDNELWCWSSYDQQNTNPPVVKFQRFP